MKIESPVKHRIYLYGDDGFVDLFPIDYYGLRIETYDFCSYWAVIKSAGTIQIVFFNDKEWFDEWLQETKKHMDIEIVYQRGKIPKEESKP